MSASGEKERQETHEPSQIEDVDDTATSGFTADLDNLPKGYYRSSFFVGTLFAIGSGLAASTGGFGMTSPNLTLINNELG